jgi:glycosyltransferase involved in cell wall biosynthesis
VQSSDRVAFRRTPDELVLGYWGFLRPDKGLETLVQAFARVRRARAARLVLAGDAGPDVAYARSVHAQLAEAGLAGDTLSTGPLPTEALSEALLGFDVCVFPFRDGLTPNRGSYSAAVAHGIKIVTTRAAGPGFEAATNTWFASPGDPDGLARAIVDAAASPIKGVARDPSADWAEIARRHVEAYRSVLRR